MREGEGDRKAASFIGHRPGVGEVILYLAGRVFQGDEDRFSRLPALSDGC